MATYITIRVPDAAPTLRALFHRVFDHFKCNAGGRVALRDRTIQARSKHYESDLVQHSPMTQGQQWCMQHTGSNGFVVDATLLFTPPSQSGNHRHQQQARHPTEQNFNP